MPAHNPPAMPAHNPPAMPAHNPPAMPAHNQLGKSMTPNDKRMRAALLAAEPVLAELECSINKRLTPGPTWRMSALQQVREALAAPVCTHAKCPYLNQPASRTCGCVK